MANINKSFNFRNGVQVDDDNFIVNANGLVGIGTSIPREILDVHGTAKITGLVTATNLAVSGVSTFYNDVKVGSAITAVASTGVVYATQFVGSASGLTGIFAIATDGWIVGSGTLSTTAKVGIGTTIPYYSLQVGNDPLTGNGFSVDAITGNVNTTGILTAASLKTIGSITGYNFSGFGTDITGIKATNISNGTLNNARLPSSINLTGIITGYSFSGFGTDITGINATNISNGTLNNSRLPTNLNISGIITSTSLNVGIASITHLYVSGVTTSLQGFVGNLVGIASTALSLSGSPSITVTNITSTNINNTDVITSSNIISGIITASTRIYAESVGVGTSSPSADIHIHRNSISKLQVTSDTAESIIAVGRSTTLTGSNGALRFGNTSANTPYSTPKSLDIINYDSGNLNFYIQLGSPIQTGTFNWFRGQTAPTSPIMTLTYAGYLGIGITLPQHNIHVSGSSTVTDNSYIGQNFYVAQNAYITGSVTANGFNGNATTATTATTATNAQGLTGTPNLNVGIVTATSFFGDGSGLTGVVGSGSGVIIKDSGTTVGTAGTIDFGDNLTVSAISAGIVTVTGSASGGSSSQFVTTSVGIHTLSNVGIGTTNPTSALTVSGDVKVTGIITASSFSGNASSATYSSNSGIATYATSAGIATYATSAGIATYATSAGIATIATYASNAGITTYATSAGIATYATSSGIATYATSAGIATYATSSGISTYATNSGIATYATSAGIATYATSSGISTYATNAGITTYATSAGIATYATSSGIATYATNSGIATYATSAGIATIATYASNAGITTYATSAGIATYATSSGIATYATNSGIATYATSSGIATTAQGLTGTPNLNVGVVTATSFVGNGSGLTGIVGGISGIVIKDSGSTVGTAGTIDFGDNLTVSTISAGIVTVTGSVGIGLSISDTPPANTTAYPLWYSSLIGRGFVYYDDGSSSQWVDLSPSSIGISTSITQWVTTAAGIHTLSNVGIGTTNPRFTLEVGAVGASGTTLFVNGDTRITGIVTIGLSSIVLNGSTNIINVGTGITIDGNSGIISATSIILGGSSFTGNYFNVDNDASINGLTVGLGNGSIITNTAFGIGVLASNTDGHSNTGIGYSALYTNTTGRLNVAIGASSLYSNTTGNFNTGVGNSSLYNNTSGNANTAFGRSALFSNTTGGGNVSSGFQSLFSNTTGSNNVAYGSRSLYSNTTGNFNTALGVFSLDQNTTGFSNVASGVDSLYSNTTGSANVASGYAALFSNTTGSANVAIGYSSLYFNTTGSANVASGYAALFSNTTGYSNVASGVDSLYSNTTGSANVAFGYAALFSNTTGYSNVAIGHSSLYFNTTGSANIANGVKCLYSNTTGYSNVAIGHSSLYSNTTGSANIANGVDSLYSNTTGYENVAIGYSSLSLNTTGYENAVLGSFSLYSNTTGRRNISIGADSLYSNTTGNNNISIGSILLTTTGSGNIGIGDSTADGTFSPVANITTENNRIVMGSTAVTNAYIQVGWTVVSDSRDKTNVAPIPHGLDFVNKLKPISFQFKLDRESSVPNGPFRYGFKAQDILALEGDNPVIIDNENSDKLRYNCESLVPVLVNAIKELTESVKSLQNEIEVIKNK